MCTVDWAALGTCVGAGAVLLGVVVAWVQLRSINTNEVIRATIDYMARYTTPAVEIDADTVITPAVAANNIGHVLYNDARKAKYRSVAETWKDLSDPQTAKDRSKLRVDQATLNQYKQQSDSIIVISNYFVIAESLLSRKRLDRSLFMETFANWILRAWIFAKLFHDVDANARTIFNHTRFRKIVRDAHAWETERKAADEAYDAESAPGITTMPNIANR